MKKAVSIPLYWLFLASYFGYAGYNLGLGAGGRPGAGFFPFGAALAIGAIALARLIRLASESAIFATTTSEWRRIICVIVGMAAYALLLDPLGFALCTFLLMAAYLKLVAVQSLRLSLGFAAGVAFFAHLFFDSLLNAQLPRGLLAWLL